MRALAHLAHHHVADGRHLLLLRELHQPALEVVVGIGKVLHTDVQRENAVHDEAAGAVVALVQVERADEGLEGVAEDGAVEPVAGGIIVQHRVQAQARRDFVELRAVDNFAAQLG